MESISALTIGEDGIPVENPVLPCQINAMKIPEAVQSKAKRDFLRQHELHLVPQADTTWLDVLWRIFGKPDGSWSSIPNQDAVENNAEIQVCTIAESSHLPNLLIIL
jgi:hypothetical protein